METFIGGLANRALDRWVGLLPGLAFVLAAWVGSVLGWAHALDPGLLTASATKATATWGTLPALAQAVGVLCVLAAAGAVGLLVRSLRRPVCAWWLGTWPVRLRQVAQRRTARRRTWWNELVRERQEREKQPPKDRTPADQAAIDALAHQIITVAMAEPTRPTWMGDRVAAVDSIGYNRYGLDLRFGWSRLWFVLPDTVRTEIAAADARFANTVVTAAWALPYLVLGLWWWPALLIAGGTAVAGWTRARTAIADLTELSEAALDLHGRTLAISLGVAAPDSAGPLAKTEGQEITRLVRKGR
ncbi:hypothetical protein F4553_000034 [Allocatelliglobosispora scoriae]|uniref:Vegetative cell wall protein gp1 n=1 Tax=Allocatelliglobosispora scoriae TaxID=643052 RepID=A0A841BGA0_9ACTN|nr:hypothetical protein [Allocatelliglobosispora scoriae]MBB5866655.1 hypothetical protein [Allocatelliglobosispora scoriae]